LAFQGGGARLAVLLATAEAIQQLEVEGIIRVTRIAGTSAGAIVGAFLAADLPICQIRQAIVSKDGEELLNSFPAPHGRVKKLHLLSRLVRGKPIWSDKPLREWLSGMFRQLGNPQARVVRELIIVSASLADGAAIKHQFHPQPETEMGVPPPRVTLVDALLESAGLPFCFRTWKSAKYFDGGICENLPVDVLSEGEREYGRAIAFSFDQVWTGVPDSMIRFSLSLLDLAITHSVEMAKLRIGPGSVCQLDSCGIGTFDFQKARQFLASDRTFNESVGRIRSWLEKLAVVVRSNETAELSEDVWSQGESEELRKMMRQIGRIYRRHHAPNLIHYRRVKLWVALSSLAERHEPLWGRPDEVYYELHFEPADGPVYAHRLLLSSRLGEPFDGRYSVRLQLENGEAIPVELLPSFPEESDKVRELIAWFHEPVWPGSGISCLTMVDHGQELMADLRDPSGCDFLGVECPRALESVGVLQLGVHVPASIGELVVGSSLGGIQMRSGEVREAFGPPPVGFNTFGWMIEDLPSACVAEPILAYFSRQSGMDSLSTHLNRAASAY
jgi:NTE family protein